MASYVPETPMEHFPQIDLPSKLPRHDPLVATAAGRSAWYHKLVELKVQLVLLGKLWRRRSKERSDRAQLAEEEAGRATEEGERARFQQAEDTLLLLPLPPNSVPFADEEENTAAAAACAGAVAREPPLPPAAPASGGSPQSKTVVQGSASAASAGWIKKKKARVYRPLLPLATRPRGC